jgi:hypothetical protein
MRATIRKKTPDPIYPVSAAPYPYDPIIIRDGAIYTKLDPR